MHPPAKASLGPTSILLRKVRPRRRRGPPIAHPKTSAMRTKMSPRQIPFANNASHTHTHTHRKGLFLSRTAYAKAGPTPTTTCTAVVLPT